MKTIKHFRTLFYYDGPQVFEARDDDGGIYVGLMVEPDAAGERFLLQRISPENMERLQVGALDLRSALLEPAFPQCNLATVPDGFQKPLLLGPALNLKDADEFLPEPGFLLAEPASPIADKDRTNPEEQVGALKS